MQDNKNKLLFITQKIHQNDDDLAFVILWIKEFIRQGADVKVICLQKGDFDESFPVFSLGKEKGLGKIKRIMNFYKYIFSLDYNRVFVHMNPEYVTLGGWYWFLKGIPIYLWYTHYTMHIHLWLTGLLSKRMFAATTQSLPQYEGNQKKVVTGHGLDIDYWLQGQSIDSVQSAEENLISVHRLCRSKRLELAIRALKYLPDKYNLTVFGRPVELDYYQELQALVKELDLESRVKFMGPVPMDELKSIYPNYKLMVNMAPETIDKTVLEGMLFGLYPITTAGNSKAVGLPIYPEQDDPQVIADFILGGAWKRYSRYDLQEIVKMKHSLKVLISKLLDYIGSGK